MKKRSQFLVGIIVAMIACMTSCAFAQELVVPDPLPGQTYFTVHSGKVVTKKHDTVSVDLKFYAAPKDDLNQHQPFVTRFKNGTAMLMFYWQLTTSNSDPDVVGHYVYGIRLGFKADSTAFARRSNVTINPRYPVNAGYRQVSVTSKIPKQKITMIMSYADGQTLEKSFWVDLDKGIILDEDGKSSPKSPIIPALSKVK
jgi:hypothetical protein